MSHRIDIRAGLSALGGCAVVVFASSCGAAPEPYVSGDGTNAPRLLRTAPLEETPVVPVENVWTVMPKTWSQPTRISVSERHIAVVDPPATRVHLVRFTDGSSVASIGREGSGPGEWTRARGAALVGDELVVSMSSTSLQVHALTGELLRTIELGQSSAQLMPAATDVIYSRGTGANAPEFTRVDMATANVAMTFDAESTSYLEEEFGNCWLHTATEGGILRMTCAAGRFELIGENGEVTRWLEWPDEPVRATEAELDAFIERFWALRGTGLTMTPIVQRQLSGLRERSAIRERYALLRSDPSTGRTLIVEQPFGEYSLEPGIIHLLTPEGRNLGRIEVDRVIQDVAARGEYLIVLFRDLSTDEIGLGLWHMRI